MFHENIFIRPVLYKKILKNSEYLNKEILVFIYHSVLSICFVFILGILVDNIIKLLTDKLFYEKGLENYITSKLKSKIGGRL